MLVVTQAEADEGLRAQVLKPRMELPRRVVELAIATIAQAKDRVAQALQEPRLLLQKAFKWHVGGSLAAKSSCHSRRIFIGGSPPLKHTGWKAY